LTHTPTPTTRSKLIHTLEAAAAATSVYTLLWAVHYGFVIPPALLKWILRLHSTSRFAEPAKLSAVENSPRIFLHGPTDNPTWNLAIYVDEIMIAGEAPDIDKFKEPS
jgi:hypothetical protein